MKIKLQNKYLPKPKNFKHMNKQMYRAQILVLQTHLPKDIQTHLPKDIKNRFRFLQSL